MNCLYIIELFVLHNNKLVSNLKDVIIIGGGGAGCAAGIYAVRAGLNVAIVTETFGGQLLETDSVENYPGIKYATGLEISGLFEQHVKQYKEIKAIEGFKVTRIAEKGKKDGFEVMLSNGKKIEGKTVIIATGKRPKKLMEIINSAERFEGKGITYCALCDGPLYKGKNVAVIGGGYAGIEDALFLSNIAEKVFVIEFNPEIGGEEISRKKVLEKKNIEIITNAQVKKVFGEKFVEGLKYFDRKKNIEKELKVSALFVHIGENTNSEFFEGKKNALKEIEIDENNMTSVKGVFAAGDVTKIKTKQLVVSAAEGCKAALAVNSFLKGKL